MGRYPKEMKSDIHTETWTYMAALLTNIVPENTSAVLHQGMVEQAMVYS